jgi:hypothetical protein
MLVASIGLADQGQPKRVGRLEGQAESRPVAVLVAVIAAVQVMDEAVMTKPPRRHANGRLVADRHVERRIDNELVEGAIGEIGLPAGDAEFGLLGHDADQTGRGVLAKQHALRPFEHLDPLDIDQVRDAAADACERHAVDGDAHRRLKRRAQGVGADTADVKAVELGFARW